MLFRSNDTATTEIYTALDTLSLHDALPICPNFNHSLRRQAEEVLQPSLVFSLIASVKSTSASHVA